MQNQTLNNIQNKNQTETKTNTNIQAINMFKNIKIIKISIYTLLALLAVMSLTPQNAHAQYKCVQNKKAVSYSDTPPTLSECKRLTITPYNSKNAKNSLIPKMLSNEAQAAKTDASKVESNKSYLYDPKACQQLKGYLAVLKEGGRISSVDEKMQHSFLDDKQRQQEIEKIEKEISKVCKAS